MALSPQSYPNMQKNIVFSGLNRRDAKTQHENRQQQGCFLNASLVEKETQTNQTI